MRIIVNTTTGAARLARPDVEPLPGYNIVNVPASNAPTPPWRFVNGELVTATSLPKVPNSIPGWKAKAVLEMAGLLQSAQAAVASLQGDEGIAAKHAWESATSFDRYGPTVTAVAAALGLSDAQLDAMFIQAESITV
jgi:hypothetical protein